MSEPDPLHLFEGFGVELEYMIVDAETLSVLPIADQLLRDSSGAYVNEVERGSLCWSNELCLHVIELKVNGPVTSLEWLGQTFQDHVNEINALLAPLGGRLMPTAMHPWMDPMTETRLWPHDNDIIYKAFDRIFGCKGHGWSNLQSVHINLPFADADEFGRLHAAIRLLMPIMPALAASSPIVEMQATGLLDNRLEAYRSNCAKIPSVTGLVIPEPVFTPEAYQTEILQPMYRDIAPYDPEGILQEEWLNARGAIARLERNTIEIRVLDVQECPKADLTVVRAIVSVLKALCDERIAPLKYQKAWPVDALHAILLDVIRDGEQAVISDRAYLGTFGIDAAAVTASELWRHLANTAIGDEQRENDALQLILDRGTLSRRILSSIDPKNQQGSVRETYRVLCDCLSHGESFR